MAQLLALQGYGGDLSQRTPVSEVSCKDLRRQALNDHNKDSMMHPDLYIKQSL